MDDVFCRVSCRNMREVSNCAKQIGFRHGETRVWAPLTFIREPNHYVSLLYARAFGNTRANTDKGN